MEGIYEKSGAGELYDALDQDTQDLLSQAGIGEGSWESGDGGQLFQALSQLLREKLAAPLKGLAALLGVVVLCRLGGIFEEGGSASLLAGTLACAGVLTVPLLELIQAAQRVIESACVFLGASVPVYSALLLASGNTAAGGSYSFWTLAAGSLIPALSSALLMPLLHMFLLLALASSLCGGAFDKLLQSLYSFAKWALVLAVTLFSGVLSVQTVLNAQVDAASGKAVKFLASSAVPIVGGAFGDAVAAIQNSVEIVKSGVGAFGILAALCIFVPTMLQGALWMGVCLLGQVAAGLFRYAPAGLPVWGLRLGGQDGAGGARQRVCRGGGVRRLGALCERKPMNQVMESVLTVCVALVAAELLRRFCPEDQMVRFVSGLVALGLLLSLVGAAMAWSWTFPSPPPRASASRRSSPPTWRSSTSRPPSRTGRPMSKACWRRLGCRQKKSRFPQIETKMAA